MAGYDYNAWKSNNAIAAEDEGLVTASKISRAWLKENGIDEQVGFIKWMIRHAFIQPTEWHHTSKMYNRTYYYDAEDIAERLRIDANNGRLSILCDMYTDNEWRKADDRAVQKEFWARFQNRNN